MSHRTELTLVPLSHEEIVRNIHDAQQTKLDLQELWQKKGVSFEPSDVVIKIHTACLVLTCIDCGTVFQSEAEAEDSPCEMFPEGGITHDGVDSRFSLEPNQVGEWADIYAYPGTGKVPNWNDLEVRRVWISSDYVGHDPAEPKVPEPKSPKYPGKNPRSRR